MPGGNSQLLLSMLIKHLEHKNVVKQPGTQMNIVNVATKLAQNVNQQASVGIISAIVDLMKHLRKCIQYASDEASNHGGGLDKQNTDLQYALEKCISQLSIKVCNTKFSIMFSLLIFYMFYKLLYMK